MEEGPPKLVDYFVLAGLTPSSKPLEDENLPRLARPAEPITDVAVIIRSLGEDVPHGFTCIERTPGGHSADLGTSLLTNQQLYLCYRRGRDRMPITELGIYYEGKESLKPELQILETTPYSHSANLSSGVPGHPRTFLTFKRAPESLGLNTLGVMDICIINPSKGESTPHTFCRVDRNLNTSMFGPALFLCYKKAMAKTHSLVYEAGVISRFPETDSDLFPFPELVPMFCLPMGATIESWSLKAKYHLPVFSTFVLTGASGDKMSPYDNVLLCQPVSSPLPLSGASYVTLLQNLGPENAVTLLLSVLTEHKLLIHSQRPDVLTSVAEALVSIIFPLRWQCPYIPLCPLTLADVLCAPVPFIVGIHSSYFDLHDPPQDVLCVDLDTNTLFQSEEKKMLPRKPCNVLRNCLSDLHKQLDEMYNKPMEEASLEFLLKDYDLIYGRRTQLELDVRASFLRFMSCLFKGYRSYLLPITQAPSERTRDSSNLFNVEGFKKSRDRAHQKFYSQLVKTQMFTQFIEDCSFVNERHASLEFFDNCVEKVQVDGEKMEDLHLVELDESHRSEHTVFIMPAEEPMDPHGIEPPAQYKYETFPILQRDLFELPQDLLMAPPAQSKTSAPSSPAPRRTKQVSERTMIGLSTCSVCPACHSLIYDEDIMAAWTSDDSNLKTVCSFCGQHFVPFLNVKITDLQRQRSASDVSTDGAAMSHGPVLSDRYQCLVLDDEESRGQCNGFPKVQHRPSDVDSEMVTVAYLCPLVLRKEVESLLENEGSEFLSQPELVNSHPIIYWNLVWYFQRLALPSNLPQLILASKHVCHPTQIPENPHVSVRLLWDILVQDPDRWPPMYVLWKLHRNLPTHLQGWRSHSHPFTLEFLEKVLNFIGLFEVHKAINLILTVLQEQNSPPQILQRGIYREMLLLTLAALGREHMDIAAFDSKYKTACKKLGNSMGKEELRKRRALLPGAKALDCRKTFGSTLEC
uniref:Uncharacterized protein n=1 Tax=Pyxicephalus adspersus TaxID=30357 RepID=A0AAV2ZIV9_PYXAD|nr:TPA: hypothetical protein GDO54_004870 [Pyxicephalus adspersus]